MLPFVFWFSLWSGPLAADKRVGLPSGRVELPVRGLIGLWLHSKLVLSVARPPVGGVCGMRNRASKILALQPLTTASSSVLPPAPKSNAREKTHNYYGNLYLFSDSWLDHPIRQNVVLWVWRTKFGHYELYRGTLDILDGLAALLACPVRV